MIFCRNALVVVFVIVFCTFFSSAVIAQKNHGEKDEGSKQLDVLQKDEAEKGQKADDRSRTKSLLNQLARVTVETESAKDRATRVREVISELNKRAASGLNADAVRAATSELLQMLDESLATLLKDSLRIKDDVRNIVIPENSAVAAGLRARIDALAKDDSKRREFERIYEEMVKETAHITSENERLDRNIGRIKEAISLVRDKLEILDLYKRTLVEQQKLRKAMEEFNESVEEIVQQLRPDM